MKRALATEPVVSPVPDDVLRLILVAFYKPQCAVDWLRLVSVSKHLARLLHDEVLSWVHRLALPLTRSETEYITDVGPPDARRRAWYEAHFPNAWDSRCALVRYVGEPGLSWLKRKTMAPVDDFLTDLHILSEPERRYDAVGLSWLLWALHVAESSDEKKPQSEVVLPQVRNRFLYRL